MSTWIVVPTRTRTNRNRIGVTTSALVSRAEVVTGRDVAVAGRRERDGRVVQRVDGRQLAVRGVVVAVPLEEHHAPVDEHDGHRDADPSADREQRSHGRTPGSRSSHLCSSTAHSHHTWPFGLTWCACTITYVVHKTPGMPLAASLFRVPSSVLAKTTARACRNGMGTDKSPPQPAGPPPADAEPCHCASARRTSLWQGRRTRARRSRPRQGRGLGVKPRTVAGHLRRPNPTGHSSQADPEGTHVRDTIRSCPPAHHLLARPRSRVRAVRLLGGRPHDVQAPPH